MFTKKNRKKKLHLSVKALFWLKLVTHYYSNQQKRKNLSTQRPEALKKLTSVDYLHTRNPSHV